MSKRGKLQPASGNRDSRVPTCRAPRSFSLASACAGALCRRSKEALSLSDCIGFRSFSEKKGRVLCFSQLKFHSSLRPPEFWNLQNWIPLILMDVRSKVQSRQCQALEMEFLGPRRPWDRLRGWWSGRLKFGEFTWRFGNLKLRQGGFYKYDTKTSLASYAVGTIALS